MSTLLYIANIRIPSERAHATQVMKMCEAFARSGEKVVLALPRRRGRLADDPFRYHGSEAIFEITYLPCIDTVSFGRLGFYLESVTFALAALFFSLKKRPSVAYGREPLALLLCRLFGQRVAFESHRGEWNAIVRLLARLQVPFVVISKGIATYYRRRHIPPEQLLIAHDAIDLVAFAERAPKDDARAALGLAKKDLIALYAGSLEEWKGYRTLLTASHLLPAPWKVVIIGGSSEKVALLQNEFPEVHFAGYRPYTELPLLQRAADVLVIPNSAGTPLSSHFTSPLKVFAHMAAEVPIVASDLPSLREVLSDEMAIFVSPDSPRRLAEGIAAAHTGEGKKKAKAARKAAKDHSWEERAAAILKYLTPRA